MQALLPPAAHSELELVVKSTRGGKATSDTPMDDVSSLLFVDMFALPSVPSQYSYLLLTAGGLSFMRFIRKRL